ncbi:hypothetical protein RRG08_014771 [Elysia crispata]|uniref:Uncharacterized protein n=1 Tax=Elysia crispata TaxID=231223 RepID=A0AAE1AWM3_9GAST|nr:hypothetical protein RRG08_014771 [Elysia crispata]
MSVRTELPPVSSPDDDVAESKMEIMQKSKRVHSPATLGHSAEKSLSLIMDQGSIPLQSHDGITSRSHSWT